VPGPVGYGPMRRRATRRLLVAGCVLWFACPATAPAEWHPTRTTIATKTSTTPAPTIEIKEPTVEVKNVDNTPEWVAILGPLGGAAVGGLATLLAAVGVASRREKSALAQEARKTHAEWRTAEAARVTKLLDSGACAVASLTAFQSHQSLDDIPRAERQRAFEAAVVLGSLQPVVADANLQGLAKELFEIISSVMYTPSLGVRGKLINDAADEMKQLSARVETILRELRDKDAQGDAAAA
jgi:hypothetical protein